MRYWTDLCSVVLADRARTRNAVLIVVVVVLGAVLLSVVCDPAVLLAAWARLILR